MKVMKKPSKFPKILLIPVTAVAVLIVTLNVRNAMHVAESRQSEAARRPVPTQEPQEYTPVTATILSTGDFLPHGHLLASCQTADGYDFNPCFDLVREKIQSVDYAVCDFEFTLTDGSQGYQTYPLFWSPYETVDAVKNAGFDGIVLANNHQADQGDEGIQENVRVLNEKGLATLGERADADTPNYTIVNLNGIHIGLLAYTYGQIYDDGHAALNGMPLSVEASKNINVFDYNRLDAFYEQIAQDIQNMRQDGAEAVQVYMHWGNEYQITESGVQEEIAQKLCDLGVDALIGGHPHVIEPAAVLTNAEGHRMFCIYSVGNMLSCQHAYRMPEYTEGHTEDGVFVLTTYQREADRSVHLAKVDYIPTWVNLYEEDGVQKHVIVPLKDLSDPEALGLNLRENGSALAEESKQRTDELVAAGFDAFNSGE
jgi:poly-gamma-glutamate capsule biosynthesis protein CapA/YwtB (metallophosphatase superfamily)